MSWAFVLAEAFPIFDLHKRVLPSGVGKPVEEVARLLVREELAQN